MNVLLEAIMTAATTALSAAILILLKHAINYLQSKTTSIKVQLYLKELETVIADGVAYTEQTLVNGFKNSDTWTKEAQYECLNSCVTYIIDNLTAETANYFAENQGDFRTWVSSKVEAFIQKSKVKQENK